MTLGIALGAVLAVAAGGPASPRVVVLRDDAAGMEAAVAPSEGGELTSLRVRFRGAWVELLYRARDYGPAPGFRGKAPFLWPAVGGQYPLGTIPKSACADGTYVVQGRSYAMPCHGFAQSLAWQEGCGDPTVPRQVTIEITHERCNQCHKRKHNAGSGIRQQHRREAEK